jgi:hypothetical protein
MMTFLRNSKFTMINIAIIITITNQNRFLLNPWIYPVGERLGKQKAMAVHVDVQEIRSHYVQHDGMSQMNGITC